jgi:hypothetical protein
MFATQPIVLVEEDWELRIRQPDPSTEAPQITCVVSPVCHARGVHAAFELNHRTQPDYVAGGMQLQVWNGEAIVSHQKAPSNELLRHTDETIRWTQKMQIADGKLVFEVVNGSSTTWGTFGGQGYLKLSVDTSLSSLNHYSPAVSAYHSGIGYAANRVAELVLKEVRLYSAEGLLGTWTTPITVHQHE